MNRNKTFVNRLNNVQPATVASHRACSAAMLTAIAMAFSGCTALTQPINGIPANRLPREFFQGDKDGLIPIDFSLLQQEKPRQYTLGPGDVLGITVDGILPFSEPDQVPEPPPVHFPEKDSTLPPSTGFPITVLEDGTISLPLLEPVKVEGLTEDQTRDTIRRAYVEKKILKEDEQKKVSPVVTVIQKRRINVIVIRQDAGNDASDTFLAQVNRSGRGVVGADKSGEGTVVKLDAFENDILHALTETGGLPGIGAKNEIKILRSKESDKAARMAFIQQYQQTLANFNDACGCPPPMPEDPSILKIPLRLPPGVLPSIRQEDVILEEGDVVLIESRENEFFYTGGLLPGGQWPIPRDYDLDALGAMAIAGGGVSSKLASASTGLVGNTQVVPPGRLYILRRTPCNGQLAIEVDLANSINNPRQRPIIQPGDTLILQFKPCEEAINFGVGAFFTYGITQLFR